MQKNKKIKYLEITLADKWVFEDAVQAVVKENAATIEQAISMLRNELELYPKCHVAQEWLKNWKKLIKTVRAAENISSLSSGQTNNINSIQDSTVNFNNITRNDIYIFDDTIKDSITKYFGMELHAKVMSSINYNLYRAQKPTYSHAWCLEVADDPPVDLKSTLKICTKFLLQAVEEDNEVDLHMAHTLTQLLPMFVAGTEDTLIEDSYVHQYLAPILQSVFSTDKRFVVQWANGALNEDSSIYKPDFLVFSQIINIKCMVIVAEFKPKSRNSSVESDLVKLGKQMKIMYNDLVEKRIPQPVVCGILCQGGYLSTYAMDLPSPRTYRMLKLSKITICRNIDELHLLPTFISKLAQVKNITVENITKAEESIITASDRMRRQLSDPPLSWLSRSSCTLLRSNKKRKSNDDN